MVTGCFMYWIFDFVTGRSYRQLAKLDWSAFDRLSGKRGKRAETRVKIA